MSMHDRTTEATASALSLSLAYLDGDIPGVRQAVESMEADELRSVLSASTLAAARYAVAVTSLVHGDSVAVERARTAMRDALTDLAMGRLG